MRASTKYPVALIFLLCLMVQQLPSRAGCQPADNLTVFNKLIDAIVQQMFARLPLSPDASILIRSLNATGDGKWLVENGIVKNLYQRGISSIYLEKSDSIPTVILDYQILDLAVRYNRSEQKKTIQRDIRVGLSVRASKGGSGQVLWLDEFQEQFQDMIRAHDVANLERDSFSFTHGKLPDARGAKFYIEPMIVTIATATVIYLFFRLRSK